MTLKHYDCVCFHSFIQLKQCDVYLNELLRQFTDETEKPSISTSMVNQRLSAQWNSILLFTQKHIRNKLLICIINTPTASPLHAEVKRCCWSAHRLPAATFSEELQHFSLHALHINLTNQWVLNKPGSCQWKPINTAGKLQISTYLHTSALKTKQ